MFFSPVISNLLIMAGTACINLPFGYWRAGQTKFTRAWFVAVHAPVPMVVVLRLGLGVHWHLLLVPLWAGAYFAGQFAGGRLRLTKPPEPEGE